MENKIKPRAISFSNREETNNYTRTFLTLMIIIFGFLMLAWLGSFIMEKGQNDENNKMVFTMIVPLIASWIGAVLAFYYGRENYEAATKAHLAGLSREKLDDLKVSNIMILRKTMVTWTYDDDAKIKEILDVFKKVGKDRIPFLGEDKKPMLMVHRHKLEEFHINEKHLLQLNESLDTGASPLTSEDLMLKHFIQLDINKERFGYKQKNGFITIKKDNSIQYALAQMKEVEDCKDIFITEDGTSNTPVIGWVTNVLANRFLTV